MVLLETDRDGRMVVDRDDTIATFMNQLPTFPAYWRGVSNFVFEFVPTISCKICKTVTFRKDAQFDYSSSFSQGFSGYVK